jgi:CHRD domain
MHLLKRNAFAVVFGLLALTAASATAQDSGGSDIERAVTNPETALRATLTEDQEVPGPGDVGASGTATVTLDVSTGAVCVNARTTGLDPLTGMHIHEAAIGVAGPVRVDFAVTTGTNVAKCVTTSTTQAQAIAANPGGFYLNLHTAAFPAGAIRGQLELRGDEAGALRLLVEPARMYDSRTVALRLEANQTRTINLAGGVGQPVGLPIGARAAVITLTVTETIDQGFLTAYSNALIGVPDTSTVNWFGSGQHLATTTTVAVDGAGRIKLTAGPRGTHFIVDLIGYYA